MHLQRILILILINLLIACHFDFDSPSDPESENYVGYPVVTDVNAVSPVFPQNETRLLFPALTWSKLNSEATYRLSIYSREFSFINFPVYVKALITNSTVADYSFSLETGWPQNYSEHLNDLETGSYYWSVAALSQATLGEWGRESKIATFTQDTKMISSGFDDESRYYYHYYSGDGFSERIDSYQFDYYIETEVIVYDTSYQDSVNNNLPRRVVASYMFSDKSCKKEFFKSHLSTQYSYDKSTGKLLEIQKLRSTDFENFIPEEKWEYSYIDGEKVSELSIYNYHAGKWLIKEDRDYFYVDGDLESIEYLEYFRNEKTGELNYKRFNYLGIEDMNIVRHELYDIEDATPDVVKLNYMYEILYLKSYPDLRQEAVFYFPNSQTEELEARFVYEYVYNVPESKEAKKERQNSTNNLHFSINEKSCIQALNFQIY